MDKQNLKRYKSLWQWLKSDNPSDVGMSHNCDIKIEQHEDISNISTEPINTNESSSSSVPLEDGRLEKIEKQVRFDITSLGRDFGKCRPICMYPSNEWFLKECPYARIMCIALLTAYDCL